MKQIRVLFLVMRCNFRGFVGIMLWSETMSRICAPSLMKSIKVCLHYLEFNLHSPCFLFRY
jgi:hypothetical protein